MIERNRNHPVISKKKYLMQEKKILFIINPISGGKNKDFLPDLIRSTINNNIPYDILEWQSASQDIEKEISKKIEEENFNILVAAGGDGTINRMASFVKGKNITLGILPFGSGNGLARFLKIPLTTEKAIDLILTGKEVIIDSGKINDKDFFCTAGVGFDAHIGALFAKAGKRGPMTYIKKITSEFNKYKPSLYNLEIDGKTYSEEAFLITFANANQWGNEAQIAPGADIQDGFLNITLIKSVSLLSAPVIASRLYLKNIHKSEDVITFAGKKIVVKREEDGPVHFDGDPGMMGKEITVEICPASLRIIVPSKSLLK